MSTQTTPLSNTAAPPVVATFKLIRIELIHESPLNPRKTFAPAAMEELTASVRQRNILSPLGVRRKPGILSEIYEVYAGHRRLRAAHAAGLTEAPCLIRDLDDQEFEELLTVENHNREDVHPLEEADGFAGLIERYQYTPQEIAIKINTSETYVHERLKLVGLIKEARESFFAGRLTIKHYLQLARLDAASQKKALPKAWQPNYRERLSSDDGYAPDLDRPLSARDFAAVIKAEFFLSLKSAPWDKTDAKLYKKAGACNVCPKRTGAEGLLFDDTGSEDNCLDAACFHKKQELHLVQIEMEARKKGPSLVRVATSWMSEKEREDKNCLPPHGAYQKVTKADHCDYTQRAVVVHGDIVGKQIDICTNKKCRQHMAKPYSSGSSSSASGPAGKLQQKKRQLEQDAQEAAGKAIVTAITGKVGKKLGPAERQAIGYLLADRVRGSDEEFTELLGVTVKTPKSKGHDFRLQCRTVAAALKDADESTFIKAVLALLLSELVEYGASDSEEVATCTTYFGLDAKRIVTEAEAPFKREIAALEPVKPAAKSARPKYSTKSTTKAKGGKSQVAHDAGDGDFNDGDFMDDDEDLEATE